MKRILKSIFTGLALLATSGIAFSLETGGLLTNDTKLANVNKDDGLKLEQKNGINLWLRTPVNKDGSSYFAAEGSFTTDYKPYEDDSKKKLDLIGDLTLFKLVLKKELNSGNLVFSAGRFYNSDLSETIYTQNGDGAKLDVNVSKINLSFFGAFTGILNAKNVKILTAPAGVTSPDLSEKQKTLYVVADKYAVGAVTFVLPHIFASQTIAVEGLAALGLESKKYNRFYGTLALNGPIVSPVFYAVSSTIGFAKYDENDMVKGNLTKASISVYPNYKSMAISLNGLYASGKQGPFEAFQGFTSGTAVNSLSEPEYSGVAKAGLSASIKPLPNFILLAGGDLVFDAKAGDKQSDIKHSGFQYTAGFNWQVVSDVSLGATFGQFIGTKDYSDDNKTQLRISAAIAF